MLQQYMNNSKNNCSLLKFTELSKNIKIENLPSC